MAPAVLEPDLLDDVSGRAARIAGTCELERQHDIFEGIQRRHQVKGLEHETDALRAYLCATVLVEFAEISAVKHDVAVGWQVEPREQRQQCRLPGPGWPDDGNGLTRVNQETDVRKDSQTTLGAANLFADPVRRENGAIG